MDGVSSLLQGGEAFAGAFGCEDDYRRSRPPRSEDVGFGIEGAAAADNDADVFFLKAEFAAFAFIFIAAGSERDFAEVNGARAAHDRVEFGTEFEHELLVTLGRERN